MKSGVETGDLCGLREGCMGRLDARQVIGLVQRRERLDLPQLFDCGGVKHARAVEIRAAMHHPVAHAINDPPGHQRRHRVEDGLHPACMVGRSKAAFDRIRPARG